MTDARKLYLVQRRVFDDYFGYAEYDYARLPVRAFSRREDAERYRQEQEAIARGRISPFNCDNISSMTSLSDKELRRKIVKLGLPAMDGNDLNRWRKKHSGTLSDEQLKAFWDLLDRWFFYEIIEVELAE